MSNPGISRKKSFVIVARGNVLAAAASAEHDPGTVFNASTECR